MKMQRRIGNLSSFKRINLIFVILPYIIIVFFPSTISLQSSCGLYGGPPCQFLPAMSGQTPSCARPGSTYCERIDNYPSHLIKDLVHQWGREQKNLLVDETWDEFATITWPDKTAFYNTINSNNNNNNDKDKDNLKDNNGTDLKEYDYETPSYGSSKNSETANHNNYPHNTTNYSANEDATYLLHKSLITQRLNLKQHEDTSPMIHNASSNMVLKENAERENSNQSRGKREINERMSLCETRSQFIIPKAAMNSSGKWKFIVNEEKFELQMVKTEICVSDTCSGLCQLPFGYNSRCEQKYVQKRLIALKDNGSNLYTDIFWFPSNCICTIAHD